MALWTPANLTTGPLRWHRADSLALANGAAINTWADEGSAAANLASGSAKPTFITGAYNGLPAVRRTTVSQKLTSATNVGITGSAPRTVFVVGKKSASSPNANILGWGAGSNNGLIFDLTWYGNEFIVHAYGGGFDTIGGVQTVDTTNLHVMAARYGSGTTSTWVDGGAKDSVSMTLATVSGPLIVGGGNYALLDGQPGTVDLCEVLIFDYSLSDAEAQMVEGYLAHRWGTAGFLPASHPYKNTAPKSGETAPGPTVGPPPFLATSPTATGSTIRIIPSYSGAVAGDILVLVAQVQTDTDAGAFFEDYGEGWNELSRAYSPNRQTTLWWRRFAGATEALQPPWLNPPSSGGPIWGTILIFRGCVADGMPFEGVSEVGGLSSALAGRPIASSGNNRLAVQVFSVGDNSTPSGTPSGWQQALYASNGTGDDASFCVVVKPVGPGEEPAPVQQWGGGEIYTAHGFALIPVNGRQAPAPQPTTRPRRTFHWH